MQLKKRKLLDFKRDLKNSKVLSADVTLAFDPNFPDATEDLNTAKLSHGVSLTKYTGAVGKIDQGGGGTIAYIQTEYGMELVDCGTPVLSMHAPIELI